MATSGDGEIRVLSDQDATMTDIGEKGRPPGDPPDGMGSWVTKVTGTFVGGRPVPESILNEEFVTARLSVEFPNGEDGEPVITIGKEVIEAMNGLWKQCMIVKVLGRSIPIAVLTRKLKEMWRPRAVMSVMDLPRQFFMVRFEEEDEYLTALTGGPWRAFGSYLMVQAWSPEFEPMRDDIVTTPVWVRLSNIPVNLYHKSILMGIAKGLGKPLKVDATTLNFERARFARVCVEVNLSKPLKGSVIINGERFFVAYEGLTNICSKCGIYGHLVHSCPLGAPAPTIQALPPNVVEQPNASTPANGGFTMVRKAGRKPVAPGRRVAPVAGGSGGDLGRNLREIPRNVGGGDIALSNSFGRLQEDLESTKVKEGIAIMGADKENAGISSKLINGKFNASGKSGVGEGDTLKGKVGQRGGPKDKRTGSSKSNGVIGPKITHKPTKPMRGLVFGPPSIEVELSSSGKRLRMENATVGRPGGIYRREVEGTSETPALAQVQDVDSSPTQLVVVDSNLHNEQRRQTYLSGGGMEVAEA